MIKKIFVFLIMGILVAGVTGCATSSKKDKDIAAASNMLEPQMALKFSDVPVPAGFKFVSQESYSFESTGVRVGMLKYRGKANPDQVVNFYKEQMPIYNWNLINAIEYGQRLLNFEREQESCIVTMLAKGNSVTLTISVGPKSQFPKKAGKPVK